MDAILIDRNFEFRPKNLGNYVKATVGIVCSTEEELLFLMRHLDKFDIHAELENEKLKKDPLYKQKIVQETEQEVSKELEKFMEEGKAGSISSLEL